MRSERQYASSKLVFTSSPFKHAQIRQLYESISGVNPNVVSIDSKACQARSVSPIFAQPRIRQFSAATDLYEGFSLLESSS